MDELVSLKLISYKTKPIHFDVRKCKQEKIIWFYVIYSSYILHNVKKKKENKNITKQKHPEITTN